MLGYVLSAESALRPSPSTPPPTHTLICSQIFFFLNEVEGAKVRRKDAKNFHIQPLAVTGQKLIYQFQTSTDQAVCKCELELHTYTLEPPTELFKIPSGR